MSGRGGMRGLAKALALEVDIKHEYIEREAPNKYVASLRKNDHLESVMVTILMEIVNVAWTNVDMYSKVRRGPARVGGSEM
jgi:hypothetical protein